MTVPLQPGLAAAIESPNPEGNGAQSPVPSPSAFAHGASGERTFTEADLARVRKEEKDKLYPELTSLRDQFAQTQKTLQELQEQRAQELAEVQRKQAEKDELQRLKKEEEMSAKALLEQKLRETNETWEQRFNQLQEEREKERTIAAKERAYNELVEYRNARLAENSADIAPQFHSFITGETKEQIDNAIAQAKIQTQSIWDEVQQAQKLQLSQQRGVAPTGYTALGPIDGSIGQKSYSLEQLNNAPMSDWETIREELGIGARDRARNSGMFGSY